MSASRFEGCGSQTPEVDSTLETILLVFSVLGAISSAYVLGEWLQGQAASPFNLFGISAPSGIWAGAALAALATIGTIAVFWYQRCASQEGRAVCASGVVNEIEESFSSGWDYVFPFTAQHTRIDLVLKSDYWPLVVPPRAEYVKCSEEGSPILQGFDESGEVCSAAAGAFIGALLGAAVGIPAGVAAAAAIGCAVTFFFVCLIVAALIVVAIVLAGAAAGGHLGRQSSVRYSDGTPLIEVGDYASVSGNLVALGDLDGAAVLWWITNIDLHGNSTGAGPPFSHCDLDEELTKDSCSI